MNLKRKTQILLVILATGGATTASANPFQFEAIGGIGKVTFDSDFFESVDADSMAFGGRFYLQPVDATSGPLAERPFIDKSAHVGVTYRSLELDGEEFADVDKLTNSAVDARFVTGTDIILEVLYNIEEFDDFETKTIGFGVGKYIDGRTTAILSYENIDDDLDDFSIFSGNFRKLSDGGSTGSAIAYELDLAYIDAPDDNGFEIELLGTYYLFEQLGITAGVTHLDIDDFDQTELGLSAEFYLSEQLFFTAEYSKLSDSDDDDVTDMQVGVGARF